MVKKTTFALLVFASLYFTQARADVAGDTEVFTGALGYVAPNVLIIFDRSGSMSGVLSAPEYEYAQDYSSTCGGGADSCPYIKDMVYRRVDTWVSSGGGKAGGYWEVTWVEMTDLGNISCAEALYKLRGYDAAGNAVDNAGYYEGRIIANTPFDCSWSYSIESLRLGNYMNFLESPSAVTTTKLQAAKDAICELLDTVREKNRFSGETDEQAEARMRFGLFTFNSNNQGGYLACELGTSYDIIKDTVSGFSAETSTPLAETLAEAGLYYAGKESWANSGVIYASPIQYSCQQNYIILMTDGMSTRDLGDGNGTNIFTRSDYMNGVSISKWPTEPKDYDQDGLDPGSYAMDGTHWMDDVAAFLYNEDLITAMDGKQNIKTYTIGFSADASDIDIRLMKSTAANGNDEHPGLPCTDDNCLEKNWQGKYILAENAGQLTAALLSITSSIDKRNEIFIAPVVPVNKASGAYSGFGLYLGLFRPQGETMWYGNLKKYGLSKSGVVLMGDGVTTATGEDGNILDNASSCWYTIEDGPNVTLSGAGHWMHENNASRTFYTRYTGSALIEFSKANPDITPDILGFGSADTASRNDLIDFIRAEGNYVPGGSNEGDHREWILGDIIHSKPATVVYGDDTYIFVGANDGFLHCFVDNDNATSAAVENISDDTIREAWCFTPWDLLPELRGTMTDHDMDGHDYLVDGSPAIYASGTDMLLTFGLRRGGYKYYTLDIGEVDELGEYTYAGPAYAWDIGPSIAGLSETLGQSWSKPIACNWKTGASSFVRALIMAGGYDAYYEDNNYDVGAYPDTSMMVPAGRAIFAVDAAGGALVESFTPSTLGLTTVDHCFIDLLAFDKNGNRFVDTIYAGNLGGQIIAARDWDSISGSEDGKWQSHVFFTAPHSHVATDRALLKFEYAPDVTLESGYDYVFIGTGDREHPNLSSGAASSEVTIERFYGIKNNWSGTTLTESDLIDVTDYSYGEYDFSDSEKRGWYIRFNERAGEKVVSQPVVFNKVVYFTTYTPSSSSAAGDPCLSPELGEGRVYALKYQTGEAYWNSEKNDDVSDPMNPKVVIGQEDRWGGVVLSGLPSHPTIIVTTEGPKLIVASSGALTTKALEGVERINRYFWQQN